MSKVKNFNKWFQEDVQDRLTQYKRAAEKGVPGFSIGDNIRLGHNTIEVMIRLPRERHSYWISLNNLCNTLKWRIEMLPEDEQRLRDFITAEAKPLLDARDAEKAKRQQQSEQAQQQAQDAAAYVANLEAEVERLRQENAQLKARITKLEMVNEAFMSGLLVVVDEEDEEDVYEEDPLT